MKPAKEFIERLKNDKEFAEDVKAALEAKRAAGASNYYETVIPVAAERGYEIKEEQLDALYDLESDVLTEEELGKVAGGSICGLLFTALMSIASVTAAVTIELTDKVSDIFD